MDSFYRRFYRNCYRRTGFIPAAPYNQVIYPGDFFQIRNGEMIVLGNIFRNGLIDKGNTFLGYDIQLNPVNWNFSEGVSKPYSGRGSGRNPIEGEFEFSKQLLAFEQQGSFFFRGNHPESVKIQNWTDFQQELILKLTQTCYSFREVYVATECATLSEWTIAIAGAPKAELEIATDTENFGLVDIFGHESARTVQSRDIEFYHRESVRKPIFFKAKKLIVHEEKLNLFIGDLIRQREQHYEWSGNFYNYNFPPERNYVPTVNSNAHMSVLDMLPANDLNPNTALLYFRWTEATMDDLDLFFPGNGAD